MAKTPTAQDGLRAALMEDYKGLEKMLGRSLTENDVKLYGFGFTAGINFQAKRDNVVIDMLKETSGG
jgi:hypothetical protein